MPPIPTARRIARESAVLSYSAGRTRWTEVLELAAGGFEVTQGEEWYDRNGERDYDWTTTRHATRAEAFAAAGIADPALAEAA
jgi:hypothetical protein